MIILPVLFLLLTTPLTNADIIDRVNPISISEIDTSLTNAATQYKKTLDHLARQQSNTKSSSGTVLLYPRSWTKNEIKLVPAKDWCSGFYPGSLWMLYEATSDQDLYHAAKSYTNGLYHQKDNHDTHDIGFILYCSYGNGIRLLNTRADSHDQKVDDGDVSYDTYVQVLLEGAQSLASRFNPTVGCIQSWPARNGWTFPVIIDNLMNLELLFWAAAHLNTSEHRTRERARATTIEEGSHGDGSVGRRVLGGRLSGSQLRAIAISHLDKTLLNHFRPDGSSFHVVDYDPTNGKVLHRQTHQGLSDASAWSRGQSWALYGYTMAYRETHNLEYLHHAVKVAQFLMTHPRMPLDKVPYWDYDVIVDGVVDGTEESTEDGGTETKTRTEKETDRLLKRVSKTSKTSLSSSSVSPSSKHEEDSDRPQSNIPVKSDRTQSNSDNDPPRDSSAAAIMCAALLELGKILEPLGQHSKQQQEQERRQRYLDASSNNKLVSSTSSNKAEPSSKTLAPSSSIESTSSLLGSSQKYIAYALAQLHSLNSPTYRTLSSSSRQLLRVSKTHPLTSTPTSSTNTLSLTTTTNVNVTIQENKDTCYFLCEEFFLLKHGTGHFPHHSEVDVPLIYGDYFYIQALLRAKRNLLDKNSDKIKDNTEN